MSIDVAILLYGSSFLCVSDDCLHSELALLLGSWGRLLNREAPFRFALLSAFSVPRSRHPRPSDARSPSQNPLRASQEVRTPAPRQCMVRRPIASKKFE
jgi:hypothetical protein